MQDFNHETIFANQMDKEEELTGLAAAAAAGRCCTNVDFATGCLYSQESGFGTPYCKTVIDHNSNGSSLYDRALDGNARVSYHSPSSSPTAPNNDQTFQRILTYSEGLLSGTSDLNIGGPASSTSFVSNLVLNGLHNIGFFDRATDFTSGQSDGPFNSSLDAAQFLWTRDILQTQDDNPLSICTPMYPESEYHASIPVNGSFLPPAASISGLHWMPSGTDDTSYGMGNVNLRNAYGGIPVENAMMCTSMMDNAYINPEPGHSFQEQILLIDSDQTFNRQMQSPFDSNQGTHNSGQFPQHFLQVTNDNSALCIQQPGVSNVSVLIQLPVIPNPIVPLAPVVPLKICTHPGCTRAFTRDFERTRHESSIHGIGRVLSYCHVPGCFKHRATSGVKGYKRPDKLTEHLRMKHGIVRRIPRT